MQREESQQPGCYKLKITKSNMVGVKRMPLDEGRAQVFPSKCLSQNTAKTALPPLASYQERAGGRNRLALLLFWMHTQSNLSLF